MSKLYAHVVNGELYEYPLTEEIIANRGLPLAQFTEIVYDVKPDLPEFHVLVESCVMKMGVPTITYTVQAESLSILLARANKVEGEMFMSAQNDVFIHEVDPALTQRILFLVKAHVQRKMDEFAASKEYTDIASAIGYRGSKVPSFAAEAERAFNLRDDCWANLYSYLGQMTNAENPAPIPKTVQDVEALLPALTWED